MPAIFWCKICDRHFRYGFDVSDGVKTGHIENDCEINCYCFSDSAKLHIK